MFLRGARASGSGRQPPFRPTFYRGLGGQEIVNRITHSVHSPQYFATDFRDNQALSLEAANSVSKLTLCATVLTEKTQP